MKTCTVVTYEPPDEPKINTISFIKLKGLFFDEPTIYGCPCTSLIPENSLCKEHYKSFSGRKLAHKPGHTKEKKLRLLKYML